MAFWKKKKVTATPAERGPTVAASAGVGAGTATKASVALEDREAEQGAPSVTTQFQMLTQQQIEERISELSEPGSSVFFYLSGSPASGGPLGHGAAVIELNPNYPGKGQKKYTLYVDHVDGLEPVGRRQKIITSDKARDVATWVKDRHYQH